jgi:hypothetical protein
MFLGVLLLADVPPVVFFFSLVEEQGREHKKTAKYKQDVQNERRKNLIEVLFFLGTPS